MVHWVCVGVHWGGALGWYTGGVYWGDTRGVHLGGGGQFAI